MELAEIRKKIDQINIGIMELINERAELLKDIADYKDNKLMQYFDPTREYEMLKSIVEHNQGPFQNEMIKAIFITIFKESLRFMGIDREKNLLISSQKEHFQSIYEILNVSDKTPLIIAGPCAVESYEQLKPVAEHLKKRNIGILRGGAYKPRTSPYEFQGLGEEGLKILKAVGEQYQLKTVTEVVDTRDVEGVSQYVDILQIGARNMHNFELLKEVGKTKLPVILKRGLSATIQEFMYAAEYIVLQGNQKVIMCERGIRTFETMTRNTLDISAIPILKKEVQLPVIVDLSHSLGRKDIVEQIAKAVVAVGADGFVVEVHAHPELALSDKQQQLNLQQFDELLQSIRYEN